MIVKRFCLALGTLLAIGSSAVAGSFNASLNVPVYPTFSVGATLSQSFNISSGLTGFVGLSTRYTPSTQSTSAEAFAGLEYEIELAKDATTRTAAYLIPDVRFGLAPTTDVRLRGTAGIRSRIAFDTVSLTLGAETTAAFNLTNGTFEPTAFAYSSLRVPIVDGLTGSLGASASYNFRTQSFGYDLLGSLTWAITPNVSAGTYLGFDGAVRFGFNLGFSLRT